MLYDFQYAVIAALVSMVLLALVYQRKGYSSPSNRVFMSLLYINLLATLTDIFTFWTISYPQRFPMWVLYTSNIVYLLLFGTVAATFLRYITALTNHPRSIRAGWYEYIAAVGVEGALLVTTPWTHWIIYYDDALVYRHGSLFWIMYAIPVLLIVNALIVLYLRNKQLNRMQQLTIITVFTIAIGMSLFQVLNPQADMFHMMCAMILLVVYIVLENPAYFTYNSTRCLSGRALYDQLQRAGDLDPDRMLTLICLSNGPRNHSVQEMMRISRFGDEAAERLHDCFGRRVFCLKPGRFILMPDKKTLKDSDSVQTLLKQALDTPINVHGELIQAEYACRCFSLRDAMISDDYLDHFLEVLQLTPPEQLLSCSDLTSLFLNQHEYREIEDLLANAIRENHFYMEYQPIYDTASRTFRSAEALLRLHDPERGELPPDRFVSIAEKNGFIVRIGEIALEMVCDFIGSEQGRTSGLEYIELNISPVQLQQTGMAERFIGILKARGTAPERINLEITETSLDINDSTVLRNISALRDYGVTFSIDDYGSGFASASYLFRLPITIVKIDRSILTNAMHNENAMIVFRDMIGTAKRLHKPVVVEGAEDESMVRVIVESGGDFIQGYYYSRPLRDEALCAFLEDRGRGAR